MKSDWPEDVVRLEAFLKSAGMECKMRSIDRESFGNRVVEYADIDLDLRVVLDRGSWFAELKAAIQSGRWYSVEILKELLVGSGEAMSFEDQVVFIEANWLAIRDVFNPSHRTTTYTQLEALSEARARKRFPGFF